MDSLGSWMTHIAIDGLICPYQGEAKIGNGCFQREKQNTNKDLDQKCTKIDAVIEEECIIYTWMYFLLLLESRDAPNG